MSFYAKLVIEKEEMNVLDCSFEFTQEADYNGRPSEKPRGGKIEVLIEATAKTHFLEWMISSDMTKNGSLNFYKRESMSNLKKVEFKGAYCLHYKEHFNSESAQPLQIKLVLSAREITIRGTEFVNNWPTKEYA